jgi:excisionase family DNA binding protein
MENDPATPELLDVHEAAALLRLSPSTVYRWAQQARLPSLKMGGCRRYRRSDLVVWLDAQAQGLADSATPREAVTPGCTAPSVNAQSASTGKPPHAAVQADLEPIPVGGAAVTPPPRAARGVQP